jgi:hypothetical protein
MKKILLPLLILLYYHANAQSNIGSEQYFDFWIGEWNLTWKDGDGTTGTGKNTISRILNNKVILESFEGLTGQNTGYLGKSWSVYNPRTQEWKQTWVDNQGAYLDFIGEVQDENRMFVRKTTGPQGNEIWQRMVFRDIKKDSFTWDWESSSDGGSTWSLQWQINYQRKKS